METLSSGRLEHVWDKHTGRHNKGRKINEKKKLPSRPVEKLYVLAPNADNFTCADEYAFILF